MSIEHMARRRKITRLCHFTPASYLGQMLTSGEIMGTDQLAAQGAAFRQSDRLRLDGNLSHVCCSFEYPNTWYLDQARSKDPNFLDWVVLTLDLSLLDEPGTQFCPFNAARSSGAYTGEGPEAFEAMFAQTVVGQRPFSRLTGHPTWWPTDDQAEVQIPGPIPLSYVTAAIFSSVEHAQRELARHALLRPPYPLPPVMVGPVLFQKHALSSMVRQGQHPAERPIP